MGKHKHSKHYDEKDYLARKMRKLKEKMSKYRDKRRHRRRSSASSNEEKDRYSGEYSSDYEEVMDVESYWPNQEVSPIEGTHIEDNTAASLANETEPAPTPVTTPTAQSIPALDSVILAPCTPTATTSDTPASDHVVNLDPEILRILGDEPITEEKFGASVHKDIAIRWSDILVNGLKDETKNELLKSYDVPENLKLAQAPVLNPEIKAAVNDSSLKRDKILVEKQKLLTAVITCIGSTISTVLTADNSKNEEFKNQVLKSLSDTGRLLCHLHFSETQTRKNFLLPFLNKEIKENIKDCKRDHLLFGHDLQENLKSMKAITKTGAELRPIPVKPKQPPKNKQPGTSAKALNWRGPPPPTPPPRRAPARPNSAAGGHRQQQQQTARRAGERRPPRFPARTSRR